MQMTKQVFFFQQGDWHAFLILVVKQMIPITNHTYQKDN